MGHIPKGEKQMLYGDTKLIVSALEVALLYGQQSDNPDYKGWRALRAELVSGEKILSPWEIGDAYAQEDGQGLTHDEAVEALAIFSDNDYYIEQGNEAMADIVASIVAEREQ